MIWYFVFVYRCFNTTLRQKPGLKWTKQCGSHALNTRSSKPTLVIFAVVINLNPRETKVGNMKSHQIVFYQRQTASKLEQRISWTRPTWKSGSIKDHTRGVGGGVGEQKEQQQTLTLPGVSIWCCQLYLLHFDSIKPVRPKKGMQIHLRSGSLDLSVQQYG